MRRALVASTTGSAPPAAAGAPRAGRVGDGSGAQTALGDHAAAHPQQGCAARRARAQQHLNLPAVELARWPAAIDRTAKAITSAKCKSIGVVVVADLRCQRCCGTAVTTVIARHGVRHISIATSMIVVSDSSTPLPLHSVDTVASSFVDILMGV